MGTEKGGGKQAGSGCNCQHILTVGAKYSKQLRKLEAGASARPSRLPQEALQQWRSQDFFIGRAHSLEWDFAYILP